MKTKDARLYLQSGTFFVYSFYHAVMIYVDFKFERDLESPWRQIYGRVCWGRPLLNMSASIPWAGALDCTKGNKTTNEQKP